MRHLNAVAACCVLGLAGGVGLSAGVRAFTGSSASAGQAGTSAQPTRIATVNLLRIVRGMLSAPDVSGARDALRDQYIAQLQQLQTQVQALQGQLQGLQPGDPQFEVLSTQMQAAYQRYQATQQDAQDGLDKLSSTQALNVYKAVHTKVNELASELGYTHVIASELSPEGATFATSDIAIQEILGRPLLRAPAEDDLTERVMAALNVKDPPPAGQPTEPAAPSEQPEGQEPVAPPQGGGEGGGG